MSAAARKAAIRQAVWARLEAEGLAAFPRPVTGRIPNFRGSSQVAARLAAEPQFVAARTVKLNPDSPQRAPPARLAAGQARPRAHAPFARGLLVA